MSDLLSRPHDQKPVVVGPGGISMEELLVEPPIDSPHWVSATTARSLILSSGPAWTHDAQEAANHALTARIARARMRRLASATERMVTRLEDWPAHRELARRAMGMGSPAPRLVLVDEYLPDVNPFWGRSWAWLWRAMRYAGWDEMQIYVTTALGTRRNTQHTALRGLMDLLASYEPLWVGLGSRCSKQLKAAGIPHLKCPHPSWHQKFESKEGYQGYAMRLIAEGMPEGPYSTPTNEFGVGDTTDARSKIADLYQLPQMVAYCRSSTGAGAAGNHPDSPRANARSVDKHKREAARRAYVMGEVKTLRDAAELVECNYNDLCRHAREDQWDAERETQVRRSREEAYRESARVEGEAVAACRKMAWGSAVLGLQQVHQSLKAGAHKATTSDVSRLVDVACRLGELGDVTQEAETQRLSNSTMRELAAELSTALVDQFGINPATPDLKLVEDESEKAPRKRA